LDNAQPDRRRERHRQPQRAGGYLPWPAAGYVFTNTVQASASQAEFNLANNTYDRPAAGRPGPPYTITLTAVPR